HFQRERQLRNKFSRQYDTAVHHGQQQRVLVAVGAGKLTRQARDRRIHLRHVVKFTRVVTHLLHIFKQCLAHDCCSSASSCSWSQSWAICRVRVGKANSAP